MSETQYASNDARCEQQRAQEIGQDQGAGSRLTEQNKSKGKIERAEQDLPQSLLIRAAPRALRYRAITLVLERESPEQQNIDAKHGFVLCPP